MVLWALAALTTAATPILGVAVDENGVDNESHGFPEWAQGASSLADGRA